MAALTSPQSAVRHAFDEDALRRSCAVIAARLDGAGSEEQELVLEAVQLRVAATREEVTIEGILPLEPLNVLKRTHSLSPLYEHGYDDALVRKGLRSLLCSALVLMVDRLLRRRDSGTVLGLMTL